MKTPRLGVVVLCLILAALSFAAVRTHAWGQEPSRPSELAVKIGQLCRDKKLDEFVALVRAKAAETPPADEVPLEMFRVAQFLYMEDKYDQSLELLKELTSRFPTAPAASLAWCGMGQVYGRLGKNEEMIAALERGMVAPCAWTELGVMDAGDTHGYACQVLGQHYVRNEEWAKALRVFVAWKPSSWCGTCWESMRTMREENILLCLARTGRFPETVDVAWCKSLRGGRYDGGLGPFALVRIYAEAGQLDDLRTLTEGLLENARMRPDLREKAQDLHSTLTAAIDLAESKRFSDHVATFQEKTHDAQQRHQRAVLNHVAAWVLVREHKRSVQTVVKGARDKSNAGDKLTQLLFLIDSPPARGGLETLKRIGASRRRTLIEELKHERSEANEATTPRARMPGIQRLPLDFYEAWPTAPKGSLPMTLPANLFAVKLDELLTK